MEVIYDHLLGIPAESFIKMIIMWIIGGVLIFLAVKKEMEPTLLLPMGFGAILVNLPLSGAVTQLTDTAKAALVNAGINYHGMSQAEITETINSLGVTVEHIFEEGPIDVLFNAGIANELFPLILFIGIGAMIDFGPLLSNPKLMLFGAAAQFGIFFTLGAAVLLGFELNRGGRLRADLLRISPLPGAVFSRIRMNQPRLSYRGAGLLYERFSRFDRPTFTYSIPTVPAAPPPWRERLPWRRTLRSG